MAALSEDSDNSPTSSPIRRSHQTRQTEDDAQNSFSISRRPTSISYQDYVDRMQYLNRLQKTTDKHSSKLWHQMTLGFVCAACMGLIMFVLGSTFISEAISSKYSISTMLCIMGMVCGLIVLVGTGILARLFISRKWRITQGSPVAQPHPECFHTCSVIYTPSEDQPPSALFPDHPPTYDSIAIIPMDPNGNDQILRDDVTNAEIYHEPTAILLSPPKYSDISAPLPGYIETMTIQGHIDGDATIIRGIGADATTIQVDSENNTTQAFSHNDTTHPPLYRDIV